jgi:hypothetical protein
MHSVHPAIFTLMVALAPLTLTAAVAPRSALMYHAKLFQPRIAAQVAALGGDRGGDRGGEKGTDEMLTLLSRAMAARGAADVEALRTLARLVGVSGGGGDSLPLNMGNATALVKAAVDAALSQLPGGELSAEARRQSVLVATSVAVVFCEVVQFVLVTLGAWLVGGGVGAASEGVIPLHAAASVALGSRQITRPVRLGVQVWVAQRVYRQVASLPRRRRSEYLVSMRRIGLMGAAALALTAVALVQLDLALTRPQNAAVSSMLGALHLRRQGMPPLAFMTGAFVRLLAALLRVLGAPTPDPMAFAKGAADACHLVLCGAGAALDGVAALAEAARTVKPLRALLDLTETDAWAVDTLKAAVSPWKLAA